MRNLDSEKLQPRNLFKLLYVFYYLYGICDFLFKVFGICLIFQFKIFKLHFCLYTIRYNILLNLLLYIIINSPKKLKKGPEYNQFTLENLFQTAEIVPEPKKARLLRGHVPEWISGNWFRTGPGKYEFGNDKYENWADPQAFWQKMTFDKGEITYQSKFQVKMSTL